MITRSQRCRRRSDRGFVLIMVLVILALAASILVSIASRSLEQALVAIDQQESLQRRWGALSCRRVVLGEAAAILEQLNRQDADSEQHSREPINNLSMAVVLGGIRFNLLLADEDAKLNVNALYTHFEENRRQVRRALRNVIGGNVQVVVHLRPAADDEASRPFDSWGQVFALEQLSHNGLVPDQIAHASRHLTLWGQGPLNVRRASAGVIDELCRIARRREAARLLIELRDEDSGMQLDSVLSELKLRRSEQETFSSLLAENSETFSLWIRIKGDARMWHELHVAQSRPGEPRSTVVAFSW